MIIAVIFFILFIISLGYIFSMKKDLKSVYEQMVFIQHEDTNKIILVGGNHKEIGKLVEILNEGIKNSHQQKLQSVEEENKMRNMIHNISHDLRTPLTVIKGYTQLLETNSSEGKQYIQHIQVGAEQLSTKIDSLFNYSIMEQLRNHNHVEVLSLTNILKEEIITYCKVFEDQNIDVSLTLQDIMYPIDKEAYKRILENCIGNVIKYGTSFLEVSLTTKDHINTLVFKNKSKQDIQHIESLFDQFYTEDMSRSSNSTGLGLAIIKELMMDYGSVSITYEDSIFTITMIFK